MDEIDVDGGGVDRVEDLALDETRLDPEGRLREALGRGPTNQELALWAAMPKERRDNAVHRVPLLRDWVDHPGEMTAAEVANEAGVAVSRWYEIAAAWKASPTLASVGSFARRPGRRGQRLDGEAVNIIQSILPGIVGSNRDAKVGTIVTKLQGDAQLHGMTLPHVNTLRTMVEREKRRLKAEAQVGGRPGLDVTGVDLQRRDGGYHVIFAVVDRTSRLILGFSPGRLDESRAAYARAARDALARLTLTGEPALPWADRTDRLDVIVGEDAEAWTTVVAEYERAGLKPAFSLVGSERRYGRYFKLAAGTSLGNLRLHPPRTAAPSRASGGPTYSDEEVVDAIEVEVIRHNAGVLKASVATGAPRPAPETLGVLEFLARSQSMD